MTAWCALRALDVVLIVLEDILFDPLAQTVLSDGLNDVRSVLFLGVDPTYHLVGSEEVVLGCGVEFGSLHHGLADGGAVLFDLLHHVWIVEYAAGDLAVSPAESEDEVQCALLLDVVIAEGAAVLELFSGEDESLLVWWDALLILDLGFDIVDGVGGFDIECDGLAGQGLYENLRERERKKERIGSAFLWVDGSIDPIYSKKELN
eukprot:CAMPEP_0202463242 /NCGR_PEP_ID=MMETSP1360-20130828/57319_1 /ASSEMBLY_ACC=CAM_ASM_000848 /TAXON_ID=515479 /ORGANISM="Licmophora paradoxa, Strain CCMP2313" /LENGTH=204 /DNA_ID=CAMNT_0049086057 /DNA_START=156 /DNA_END=769 /DNA_ORIENTATION=+